MLALIFKGKRQVQERKLEMKSITLQIPVSGLNLRLSVCGKSFSQVVLVLPDEVNVSETQIIETTLHSVSHKNSSSLLNQIPISPVITQNGFPLRNLTEETIVQILREHGGSVKIRDVSTGWNIYDEIAARLGVSIEARRRLTRGTGEAAWRPEVGYARKNLEQHGAIKSTDESGRGIWALAERTGKNSLQQ